MWISEITLRSLLGHDRADAFIQNFGRQRLYIPVKARKSHKIAKAVGLGAMGILCREYGLFHIEIPGFRKEAPKKQRIIELLNNRVSKCEIARKVGVSIRYVRMVDKKRKHAAPSLEQ